ncbi:hypothetical protein Tco_0169747 [Tanacetum coccineum]
MSNKKKLNVRSNKRSVKLPTRYNDHVMSNLSQNKSNSKSIEDLDEIRVHNRGKQSVSEDVSSEKIGIRSDDCDVVNNECLDIGKDDCGVLCDEVLQAGSEISDKECLEEGNLNDKETVNVNKSASKENKSDNNTGMTDGDSTNQEDRN